VLELYDKDRFWIAGKLTDEMIEAVGSEGKSQFMFWILKAMGVFNVWSVVIEETFNWA
jgi:hypothetical protein